ncbi:uncharacterized protein LOC140704873 [Pogona vitticeps]
MKGSPSREHYFPPTYDPPSILHPHTHTLSLANTLLASLSSFNHAPKNRATSTRGGAVAKTAAAKKRFLAKPEKEGSEKKIYPLGEQTTPARSLTTSRPPARRPVLPSFPASLPPRSSVHRFKTLSDATASKLPKTARALPLFGGGGGRGCRGGKKARRKKANSYRAFFPAPPTRISSPHGRRRRRLSPAPAVWFPLKAAPSCPRRESEREREREGGSDGARKACRCRRSLPPERSISPKSLKEGPPPALKWGEGGRERRRGRLNFACLRRQQRRGKGRTGGVKLGGGEPGRGTAFPFSVPPFLDEKKRGGWLPRWGEGGVEGGREAETVVHTQYAARPISIAPLPGRGKAEIWRTFFFLSRFPFTDHPPALFPHPERNRRQRKTSVSTALAFPHCNAATHPQ